MNSIMTLTTLKPLVVKISFILSVKIPYQVIIFQTKDHCSFLLFMYLLAGGVAPINTQPIRVLPNK